MKKRLDFNMAMLILFLVAIFIIIKSAYTPESLIENEAEIVLNRLTNGHEMSLLKSEELIEEKLKILDGMDYDEIKNIFGIKSDFCIYFEDVTGNIVQIDNLNLGIGSDKIYINGKPCE